MALQNYAEQKRLLAGLDVAGLTAYANALNTCAEQLNNCWTGNADKAMVFDRFKRQLDAVNKLRQNLNWVQKTAGYILDRMNELGKLGTFQPPPVPPVPEVPFAGSFAQQTRLQLNTGLLRTAMDTFNPHISRLDETQGVLKAAVKFLDTFLLGWLEITKKLHDSSSLMDAVLNRHRQLFNTIHSIADIYDGKDDKLKGVLAILLASITTKHLNDLMEATKQFVMRKKVDEFVDLIQHPEKWPPEWHQAKTDTGNPGIDVDGAFGAQCADISKAWFAKLYGLDPKSADARLSAWNDAGTAPMTNFPRKDWMTHVDGGQGYLAGDIAFTKGHTFVIISDQDGEGNFWVVEQNPNSPKKSLYNASQITDAFRYKAL